ncbi:high mobility group B protein 3-like [Bidens hawaiensis]|uniref:high mobility group B protein 3-like n=1 Tax=Bidens hawaiensis TaxID=980011 RepID=UPI00404AB04D
MKGAKGEGAAAKRDALKPVDDKKVGKKKAPAKDPNKPKRPPSAFFVFLEEFRKTFRKENPNVKAVSAVGKAGGEKWKSMSAAEKTPYEAKAAKRKTEYEKVMKAYNKKQVCAFLTVEEEESDKSKSQVDEEDTTSSETPDSKNIKNKDEFA